MKKYLLINAIAVAMVGCGGSDHKSTPASSSSSASSVKSVASSSASSSSVAAGTWKLVWSDEFDGTTIDKTKWGFEENCWGGGNGEQECYTTQAKNAFVADGKLNIVAVKEDFTGVNSPDGTGTAMATLPYTSARLRTKYMGDWTFGRFEIRAKLPHGQGTWPAIWMLPTDSLWGGWASSGEIDIMEAVNLQTQTDEANAAANTPEARVYGTLHYGRAWPQDKSSGEPYKLPNSANPADDFHTYALEWEDGEIRWYVDGVHYQTQRKAGWYGQYMLNGVLTDAPDGAPFDSKSKFHMLLNLAVGGAWSSNVNGKGVDATVFPQTMQVDYVRVYECDSSPTTGKGCATIQDSAKLNTGNARPSIVSSPNKLESDFDVFIDAPNKTIWDTGLTSWDNNSGNVKPTVVDSDDPARGKVIDVKYGSTSGLAYIQSSTTKDASAFKATGNLVFDVKVLNYGAASGLVVKADCVSPCSSGDIPIGKVGDGVWQTVTVPVSKFITGGLDITHLNTPFVIFPTWGSQSGVELQVDNVRWTLK